MGALSTLPPSQQTTLEGDYCSEPQATQSVCMGVNIFAMAHARIPIEECLCLTAVEVGGTLYTVQVCLHRPMVAPASWQLLDQTDPGP